jgi:hypothetical protein
MKKLTEAQILLRMRNGEEFVIEDDVETDKIDEKAPQMSSGKSKAGDAAERCGGAAARAAKASDKNDAAGAKREIKDAQKFLNALKKAVA